MILSAKINHKNQLWVWAAFAALLILSLIRYEHFAGKRHFGDFHVYYVAGERILSRSEIYFEKEENLTPFKYSPLVASFFALLAVFPESVAAGIWHVMNLLLLWFAALLSWRLISSSCPKYPVRLRGVTTAIALFSVSPSILHCLNSGQVGLAIAVFFYLGIYFTIRGMIGRAAWCFAFASMFKYLPVMILPYFLLRRNIRFLILFTIALIGLHFLPAVWLGWAQNLAYLKSFIPHITATTLDHISLLDFKNQSLWAYGYRLIYFDVGYFQIADHPQWLTFLGGGFLAILYASLVVRKGTEGARRILVDLAVFAVLIVIFNPNAWKHNFVLLLLPCMLVASDVVCTRKLNFNATVLLLVTAAFFCTNRSVLGWGLRHDLMSLSILPLASLFLVLVLFRIDQGPNSLIDCR